MSAVSECVHTLMKEGGGGGKERGRKEDAPLSALPYHSTGDTAHEL